jgi:hypothetical protein
VRFVRVQEQFAIAATGAEAAQSVVERGSAWRRGVSVTEGVAMRAVTRVFVELARDVATQTLAVAHTGQLGGQSAYELFGFVDDPRDCRHAWFLAQASDRFGYGRWRRR